MLSGRAVRVDSCVGTGFQSHLLRKWVSRIAYRMQSWIHAIHLNSLTSYLKSLKVRAVKTAHWNIYGHIWYAQTVWAPVHSRRYIGTDKNSEWSRGNEALYTRGMWWGCHSELHRFVLGVLRFTWFWAMCTNRKKYWWACGICGVNPEKVDGVEEASLGYRLARKYWSSGLATEAFKAVLEYSFEVLTYPSVVVIIEPENIASLRVTEKVGFNEYTNQQFHERPVRVYRMSRDEWIALYRKKG